MNGVEDGDPFARFDSFEGPGRGFELHEPVAVIEARRLEEVLPSLARLEQEVASGLHAAGYIAYEAAPALDSSLVCHPHAPALPLVWFGVFRRRVAAPPLAAPADGAAPFPASWRPSMDFPAYASRAAAIREWIAAGDSYQVNLTFPLHAPYSGSDLELYAALGHSQRAGYCALLRLPGHSIVSASPELFFRWSGGDLELRPMKGTRPRGRWVKEDREKAAELLRSEKERAENLMIVDLLRNDAGRVAEFGTVRVSRLFEVESYPTVHQLTSTIHARPRPGTTLVDLFRALFPSGSVTGAPKVRTMQIIAALERAPRGVYTGALGFVSRGEAVFNVPIRTLVIDRRAGAAGLGVGSGVTYDSDPADEYRECLQKAAFTRHRLPDFDLLETLLHEPRKGFFLLQEHLERLAGSAAYFQYPLNRDEAERRLTAAVKGSRGEPLRIRLLLDRRGCIRVERHALGTQRSVLRAGVASSPVDSTDALLFHKTTWRVPYEHALAEHPESDEVLLRNERDELTEFTTGNLVVRHEGEFWTPPLDCGLLPGVYRELLVRRGEVRERVLRPEDLAGADSVYRINSVRRWSEVRVIP